MVVSSRIRPLFLLPLFRPEPFTVRRIPLSSRRRIPLITTVMVYPTFGLAAPSSAREKHLAEMAKAFGEASMTDNGLTTGEQARQFAFGQVRDALSGEVNQQIETWLSPWGSASVDLLVDEEGKFTGSSGRWFVPWQDNNRYLSWSQLGLTQQTDGLVSNAGIGQRWLAGTWLLGYNTFYDNLLDENLQRAGWAPKPGRVCACRQTTTSRLPAGATTRMFRSSAWPVATMSRRKHGCRGSIT